MMKLTTMMRRRMTMRAHLLFLNEEIHKLERETNTILDLVQCASQETPSSSLLSLSSSLLSQEKKRKNNNKKPELQRGKK